MAGIEFEDMGLRVTRVFRNGHRRYDAASKDRLVSACLRPGASISGLALAHGVNANLLRKWVGMRLAQASAAAGSFVAVQLADHEMSGAVDSGVKSDARHRDGFIDQPLSCRATGNSADQEAGCSAGVTRATVWLPNGVKVVLDCGVSEIGAVLGALAHVPSGR